MMGRLRTLCMQISAIARVKGGGGDRDFTEYRFCNDKTLSDPPNPGHFCPGSFLAWVVSAWVVVAQFLGGSFRPR